MNRQVESSHSGIGGRLRLVRGRRSRDEFAALVGVSRNTLMRYEQGERYPDAEFLRRLCEACQVEPGWLLLGQDSPGRGAQAGSNTAFDEEFALVPLYSVEVSAGFGAAIDQERPVTRLAFRQDWLKELGLQAEKTVTVMASGDSMENTIHHGDVLLVNTAQRQLVKDAIYVIRQEGLLYVKRLQRLYDGSIRVGSDNKAYADEVIPKQSQDCLEIIGRVVWRGGRL